MRTLVTRTRRVSAAALVVLTALALGACDTQQIGAAAVVGDQRISVGELQDQVVAYSESLPEPQPPTGDTTSLQQALLERRIRHELFTVLAEREGVSVSEADIDRFLEDFAAQQGGDLSGFYAQNGFTEESVRPAVRDELVRQELLRSLGSDEAIFAELDAITEEIGVEVNPRYGSWEAASLQRTTGSISEPAGGEPQPPEVVPPAPEDG
ncbi:MAG TPA: SurA N-terminal domain-containing protein [Jiangellales bacterium]|nr:SurA N-terminal domain-containing protein [Jiangellales bacterium]